jgi:hypothetical protein
MNAKTYSVEFLRGRPAPREIQPLTEPDASSPARRVVLRGKRCAALIERAPLNTLTAGRLPPGDLWETLNYMALGMSGLAAIALCFF